MKQESSLENRPQPEPSASSPQPQDPPKLPSSKNEMQGNPLSAILSTRLRQNLFSRLPNYTSASQQANRPTAVNTEPSFTAANDPDPFKYPGRDPLASFMVNQRTQGNRSSFPPEPSASPPSPPLRRPFNILDDIIPPKMPEPTSTSENQLSQDLASQINTTMYRPDETPIYLRLRPTLGRTVPVDVTRGFDVVMAFRHLEKECMRNQVKTDARIQRTYIRAGQRRKDTRIRRWKALFSAGYMHEMGRIKRMRNQGW